MSTQRFGLENGGTTTGKFATIDRDLFDRLLAAFELHVHDGDPNGAPLADPDGAPTTTLGTDGTIANGGVYYYRVSYIDSFGLETAASDEVEAVFPSTPTADEAPTPTGSSADGSTLAPALYYYALTAVSDAGQSPLGPPSIITVQADQNQVTLALPELPAGATGWNVWREAAADIGWTRIATGVTSSFTDTGFPRETAPTDPATQPPDILLPVGSNSVTITVPGGAFPAGVIRWRLYRTDSPGSYGLFSLVAEVVDPGTGLPTTVTDTGVVELSGTPLETSTTLTPSLPVNGGGGTAEGLVLTSPDGSTWQLVVDDDGALSTTRLTNPPFRTVTVTTTDTTLHAAWPAGSPFGTVAQYAAQLQFEDGTPVGSPVVEAVGTESVDYIDLTVGAAYRVAVDYQDDAATVLETLTSDPVTIGGGGGGGGVS